MRKLFSSYTLTIVITFLITNICFAQSQTSSETKIDRNHKKPSSSTFSIGPGTVSQSSIYKETQGTISYFPLILYTTPTWRFEGDTLKYSMTEELQSEIKYETRPLEKSDSKKYKTLEIKRGGLKYTLNYSKKIKQINYSLSLSTLPTESEQGLTYSASLGQQYQLSNNILLTPSLGFDYLDNRKRNYLYGVEKSEGSDSLKKYNVKNGFIPTAQVNIIHFLTTNRKWMLFGNLSYNFFNNDIYNSPLVESSSSSTLLLSAIYNY